MIGPSLADLVLEIFCFAASPSFRGVATLVSKARQAVKDAGSSSPELAKDHSDLGKHITDVLTIKVKAARQQCLDLGVDVSLLTQAETAVAALISTDAEHDLVVLSAVRDPAGFENYLRTRAAKYRQQIEEQAEPYFDALVRAVAAAYVEIAPWSDSFVVIALKSLLGECTDIKEQLNASQIENRQLFNQILQILQSLTEAIEYLNEPSYTERVNFGSRPDVVAGDRFIERGEQKQLKAVITDPTRHRTVLLGMRGCGKTQLAAALAHTCEEAQWSLVAWMNAGSRAQLEGEFIELARKLKIDLSDDPDQQHAVRRCLDQLRSANASDRLIVFDNVEDIEDLRDRIPRGTGLRVVATTTSREADWEENGWKGISVGVFSRVESINYLLTVTGSQDRDTADAIAERLGDLPLAIAQAAATARNEQWTLASYARRLESSCGEKVIRRIRGHYYSDAVSVALRMATDNALKRLEDSLSDAARRQLRALCLLAESGVPTHWLDPAAASALSGSHDAELDKAAERAHRALIALINASIIHQSAYGNTVTLHRLHAQVLRQSWDIDEQSLACDATAMLLSRINIDAFPQDDTDSRRRETLNLIEQLRAIGAQDYSHSLLKNEEVRTCLHRTLSYACDLGLPFEALTLLDTVDVLQELLGEDHPDALASRNNLAGVYESAGRLTEAIALYEQVLTDRTRILGEDHPDTLTSRNNLAGAYREAGRLREAITLYEQVLTDRIRIRILGEDHPDTLTSRNNLAGAYRAAGRLTEAITLYEQVLPDRIRILGEDHPDTLTSRNNLAGVYQEAGRLGEAITLYEQVLTDRTRVLGEDHPDTLTSRDNLAYAYRAAGRLTEAIALFEQVLTDRTRVLGEDHPDTLTSRHNLAGAYQEADRLGQAITLYEQVLTDSTRVLGEDHPDTLTSRHNLAYVYERMGRLGEAIALFEQVLTDSTRVLGEDHPHALTSRHNLAYAYQEAGRLTEAITLYEQVLPDRIRVLGEDHPDTLASRHNLAYAYRAAGRLTEAIALFEQVLPDRTRVLGEDHPHTLTSRHNLAYAYRAAGRLTEAITLYEQVLPDRIRVLGEDHPDTLTSRNNLAYAYQEAGRLTEAITLYEQVLTDRTRVLGEDHPDTLTTRHNLAYAYQEAGRLEEAITLFEQVLTDRIRILGEDHPDTLTSRNNLAYAYYAVGRLEEAIALYEQVTKDCARVLGEDHPLTKTVRENLEAARRELAQREDSSPTEEREED